MPAIVLSILLLGFGLFCSITLVVLMVAGSANTTPQDVAVLRRLMLFVLAAAAACAVTTIAALAMGRPAIAVTAAWLPAAACVAAFFGMLELSNRQVGEGGSGSTLIVRTLVLLVFGGGGLLMFYVGAREREYQRQLLADARPVPARMIESRVRSSATADDLPGDVARNSSTTSHTPDVRFRYAFGGSEFESDLLRPSAIARGYASRDAAAAELAPFPPGATVTAYVSPAMPDKGYLIPERSAGPWVFLIVGAALGPIALLAGRLI